MSAVAGPHAHALARGVPSLAASVHACMPGHRNAPRERAILGADQDLLCSVRREIGPAVLSPGAPRRAQRSCIAGAGASGTCRVCTGSAPLRAVWHHHVHGEDIDHQQVRQAFLLKGQCSFATLMDS